MTASSTFVYTNLDPATEERYGELWCWYLENLEHGAFENIANDTRRRTALDQFVSQYVTSYDSNVLVLLLPTEDISRSPSLVTSLLSKYYGINEGEGPRTVTITPMGAIQHNRTSVLMVREQGSHPADLSHTRKPQSSVDMDSVFSGEAGYVPSIQQPVLNNNTQTFDDDDDDDDDESIDSCSPRSSVSGVSLTRVSTIQDPTSPVVRVMTQDQSDFSYAEGEMVSQAESQITRESSGYSLRPFPTMVSAASALNHRLVLRSILLRDLHTNETKTAVRQIEDDGMGDDWMLYDETFSLNNLQLLTLDEVIEAGAMACKFLFYALIADHEDDDHFSDDEELHEHDLTVVEFDGAGLQSSSHNDLSYPIRFVQSNTTTATTPIVLSKTNTLRTNHESIKSEMLMHRPDQTYTAIQKSKSTPTASSIRKVKRKRHRSIHNDKCVVM